MEHQSTLRPSTIKYHLFLKQVCSCCKESGHNIKKCDDLHIDSFIQNTSRMLYNATEKIYLNYLQSVNTELLNAVCLRMKLVSTMYELKPIDSAINILLADYIRIREGIWEP